MKTLLATALAAAATATASTLAIPPADAAAAAPPELPGAALLAYALPFATSLLSIITALLFIKNRNKPLALEDPIVMRFEEQFTPLKESRVVEKKLNARLDTLAAQLAASQARLTESLARAQTEDRAERRAIYDRLNPLTAQLAATTAKVETLLFGGSGTNPPRP